LIGDPLSGTWAHWYQVACPALPLAAIPSEKRAEPDLGRLRRGSVGGGGRVDGEAAVPARADLRHWPAAPPARVDNAARCNSLPATNPIRRIPMGPHAAATLSERADELEERMMEDLERIVTKSVLFNLADGKVEMESGPALQKKYPGKYMLMGADPRLPAMPDKPTLIDFFKCRFATTAHLLQSAKLALKNGMSEKVVLACLLHDIGVASFIRADHGYWGAQLIEPYVDEEVSWAVRMHQALRFYPDEAVGYAYPEMYVKYFGPDYRPEPYIEEEYKRARNHKWYMSARMICVNDLYAFDPNAKVELEEFADIIGRHFRQPKEGLGFDNSPSSHMWRTIMWPNRFL
jgi:hypothetical protein